MVCAAWAFVYSFTVQVHPVEPTPNKAQEKQQVDLQRVLFLIGNISLNIPS